MCYIVGRSADCLQVHGSLEVLALLIIASELGMKVKRLGVGMFVRHVRTMIKVPCHCDPELTVCIFYICGVAVEVE